MQVNIAIPNPRLWLCPTSALAKQSLLDDVKLLNTDAPEWKIATDTKFDNSAILLNTEIFTWW